MGPERRSNHRPGGERVATPEEVVEHVRSQIASYKKPRHIEFAESIPKKGYTPDYDALDAAYGGGGYPGV